MLINSKYTQGGADESNFLLRQLGGRLYEFFDGLVQLAFWDTFLLAMMEILEELGENDPLHHLGLSELRAWQAFLHLINENMILGYQQGRNDQGNSKDI
uniref:Timeless n=1 Tax=Ditylenchus dipsaci TaxID=166011 RepID=A0A915E0J4_9BILA